MYNVVVYGAGWCGPCIEVKKLLENNNIYYKFIDIDENSSEKIDSLTAIPYIEFVDDNNNVVYSHTGAISKRHLFKFINGEIRK